jgi:hypothetical protein
VGRRDHLGELHGFLSNGTSALLIGGRRSGKSTLARRLATELAPRRVVFTDVEGWPPTTEETALGGLLGALKGKGETAYARATRSKIIGALERRLPVTLIIDEADLLLKHAWGRSFLSFLRYLDDNRLRTQLSILLVGGPILAHFRDPDDRGSPPLNTAEPTFIEPLDTAAIEMLVDMIDAPRRPDSAEVVAVAGGQALWFGHPSWASWADTW